MCRLGVIVKRLWPALGSLALELPYYRVHMHDLVSRANYVCLRPNHMRKLYELSQAPNKIFKPLPGGDHNSSVLEEGYFESISDFIASITQEYPTTPPEKSRM